MQMHPRRFGTRARALLAGGALLGGAALAAHAAAPPARRAASPAAARTDAQVGRSPWGPTDERGRLNLMTDASRAAILARIDGRKVYDLGVEYFVGMPSWQALGDPPYQIWMTHTPQGTIVDDPLGAGRAMNEKVTYTGDAVSMYTHTGTHIDALNHFGLHDRIWNGFHAEEHVGDRGWHKAGAETIPPIVARGVLVDVAAARGVEVLPPSYGITARDLQDALARQRVRIQRGDVVLIRTGRMRHFTDKQRYMDAPPGLTLGAARWLVDEQGAMVVGADNLSVETFPVETPDNWIPVHTWLLAERGVPMLEVVDLEALARDRVHEFAFVGASLKLRGASGAPMRPIAFPLVSR
jgi:kynurenine formamidase